jgi:hypothetical protein
MSTSCVSNHVRKWKGCQSLGHRQRVRHGLALYNLLSPEQTHSLENSTAIAWIRNVTQQFICFKAWFPTGHCWEEIEPLRGGACGRKLGHWGSALLENIGTPPLLLCLLPGHHTVRHLLLYELFTMMYCLTTGPKAMESSNHELK